MILHPLNSEVLLMTEKEKMLAGMLYDPTDPELVELRERAHRLSKEYNDTLETDEDERDRLMGELLPNAGEGAYFQGPIQFDYGCFTTVGENSYANFNFICLDCAPVSIGANAFIGPNVSLLTPVHPLRWQERNLYTKPDGTMTDREYARPITIGDNCWLGGSVTVCGGVTIGEGSVIGAGSVVVNDIPPNVFAAGNPCRVIRDITEADAMI